MRTTGGNGNSYHHFLGGCLWPLFFGLDFFLIIDNIQNACASILYLIESNTFGYDDFAGYIAYHTVFFIIK